MVWAKKRKKEGKEGKRSLNNSYSRSKMSWLRGFYTLVEQDGKLMFGNLLIGWNVDAARSNVNFVFGRNFN